MHPADTSSPIPAPTVDAARARPQWQTPDLSIVSLVEDTGLNANSGSDGSFFS